MDVTKQVENKKNDFIFNILQDILKDNGFNKNYVQVFIECQKKNNQATNSLSKKIIEYVNKKYEENKAGEN